MKVKGLGDSAKKWGKRAGAAAPEFRDGVTNPRRPWKGSTLAAREAYDAGVVAAIARDQFSKGVEAAGDEKWRKNALTKGVARYPTGVAGATDDWAKGFSPYHSALSALDLPPKGPRGAPGNIERVRVITEALHRLRIGE